MQLDQQYERYVRLIDQGLEALLPLPQEDWPINGIPRTLMEALRYSLLTPGKRLRPVLLLAAYESLADQVETALPFALAVELIHTYSLVHDDLPAMDDDDLRRGRPTSHKVFGEAMAILAGDAMLSLAFELMASSKLPKALPAMREIASRAGASGMIAGQVADIGLSGQPSSANSVRYIHQHKTADLITAPLVAGLLLAGAEETQIQKAAAYGQHLGLAFQITDDLLDLAGDPELTGKAGSRDHELGKQTWPAVVGQAQAQLDAQAAVAEAVSLASAFARQQAFFEALALSVPNRVK